MEKNKATNNQLNNKIMTMEVDKAHTDVFVGSPCSADDAA
jgi:hypothetical protein